jgi:hypothetical protein
MKFNGVVRFGVLVALAAVSAGMAWADGSGIVDPKVEITAPKDQPVCTPGENSASCFSGDTITIDGTINASILLTYDGSVTLDALFIDVTPTIPHDFYSCDIVQLTDPTGAPIAGAFTPGECSTSSDSGNGELIFLATCDGKSDCVGLAPFQGVGAVVETPEPAEAELLLFGIGGVFLIGFGGRKGWKLVAPSQVSSDSWQRS